MKDLNSLFPFPSARDGQIGMIEKILTSFEDGKRFAIIEAPTGTGKSAIGYTVGRYFGDYYYITAQKILQSQLTSDFGEDGKWSGENPMIELKGRNAYNCDYYDIAINDPEVMLTHEQKSRYQRLKGTVSCAEGECKKRGKSRLSYCKKNDICPYFTQVDKATHSPAVLMNFHSFIFQTEFVPDRWPKKSLLIIDEAHNTEQVLMDYISFRISDFGYDFTLPKNKSAEEYAIFLEEIDIESEIKIKIEEAIEKGDSDEEERWAKQIIKFQTFMKSISEHEWVAKFEQKILKGTNNKYNEVELKPLFVKDFAHDLLFSKADHIIMMSATILDVGIVCESLGINKEEVYAKRINSDFPVENRPIYYKPSGNMAFKSISETLPIMAKDIDKICEKYSDQKGIIHTHTFKISEFLKDNCKKSTVHRFFFQNDFESKDEMIAIHSRSENGIIVAPAMHEGLDLKNDLSRFQVICKVPYPGLGDNPLLTRRMELSREYYGYLTALKIVQQYGRSIRSKDDYADTYILDSGFKGFFEGSKKMLPSWFIEAIVWK